MAIKPFLIIFFNDFKKACLAILFFDLSSFGRLFYCYMYNIIMIMFHNKKQNFKTLVGRKKYD